MSSLIPDINIYTDHEAIDFRLMIYDAVLLESRYYAFNGCVTVSDIAPIIEQYIISNNEMNLVDVKIETSFGDDNADLEFRVLYCDKLLDLSDSDEWLCENFLTLSNSRRIAPDSYINVSWYATEQEGIMFRVYVTFLDDNGRRQTYQYVHSGNGQVAHVNKIIHEYIYLSQIRDILIEHGKALSPVILSVTVRRGNRSASFFIDPTLDVFVPIFYLNCFGVVEHIALPRTTSVKVKTNRSIATLGNTSQFYDITTSKEYDVESGPLTSDECAQVEQLLTSQSVRIPFGNDNNKYNSDFEAMRPIFITDYTCEISDSDEKLNKIKFTWRFADNRPVLDIPTTPGIFNDKFNPVFS